VHCSERERAADEAEYETEDMKKAEYMARFVGRVFAGTVSDIAGFGLFVTLGNTVEGLVRVSDMSGDYYEFDPGTYTMAGEHTGKTYSVGDVVKVRLTRADPETRQIDFELLDAPRRKHGRRLR
jgi:ribonuclease R